MTTGVTGCRRIRTFTVGVRRGKRWIGRLDNVAQSEKNQSAKSGGRRDCAHRPPWTPLNEQGGPVDSVSDSTARFLGKPSQRNCSAPLCAGGANGDSRVKKGNGGVQAPPSPSIWSGDQLRRPNGCSPPSLLQDCWGQQFSHDP